MNCDTVKDLIEQVQLIVRQYTPNSSCKASNCTAGSDIVIYVSTNDDSQEDLKTLQLAGFKIFKDMQLENTRSIDAFLVDVYLMTMANKMVHFGFSNVNVLAQRIRESGGVYAFPNEERGVMEPHKGVNK